VPKGLNHRSDISLIQTYSSLRTILPLTSRRLFHTLSPMESVLIVIRARNEEQWIGRCLRGVFMQSYRNFTVMVVDNNSSDHTLELADQFPVAVTTIDEYKPGKAINIAVRLAESDFVVCLSAHCIPSTTDWLCRLVDNMSDQSVAGVYGRQYPFEFTSAADTRDLLLTFRSERLVQTKDGFFHNANSLFRRSIWARIPFDETVDHIEDQVWGTAVTGAGYKLVYDPSAGVHHFHGIHHHNNRQRTYGVLKVLKTLHRNLPPPIGFTNDDAGAYGNTDHPSCVIGAPVSARLDASSRRCKPASIPKT
jgi:glycosyltransferase involved in cell wall biosynthesis